MSAWNSTDEAIKTLIPLLASRLQVEETILKLTDMSVETSDGAFFVGKKKVKVVLSDSKSRDCVSCLKRKHDAGREETMLAQPRKEKTTAPVFDDDYVFKSADLQLNPECWYANLGASEHMRDQKFIFQTTNPIKHGDRAVKGVGKNNEALYAAGIVTVAIKTKVNGEWNGGLLYNVLFVPDLGAATCSQFEPQRSVELQPNLTKTACNSGKMENE